MEFSGNVSMSDGGELMGTLAIIPARAGSKRLINKNIQTINGKTLLEHAIQTSIDSGVFSEILVTSDDRKYLEIASQYGVVLHLRPPSLSGDFCKLRTLVAYLLEIYYAEGNGFENVALVIPTSPLRNANDLRMASALLEKHKEINGVMSISSIRYPPRHSLRIDKVTGLVEPMFPKDIDTQHSELEKGYIHDGSIIFARTKSFMQYEDFYMPKIMPYYISEERSIDINTPHDLKIARFLMGEYGRE
jgi:CMP-N-acetylneuraminic acid synthetase